MHLDLELERVSLGKLQSSNLEMQSMKNMMESMAQNMQAMQNMMINNGGTHMVDQSLKRKKNPGLQLISKLVPRLMLVGSRDIVHR